MKKQQKSDENQTPAWLQTIQLNSWEAELLISALVLYALFQVPENIQQFALRSFERDSLFHGFFRLIRRAVELLSFGYIIHILVRGLWVANVGLSYVFPKGINKERLKFKGKFGKEIDGQASIVKGVLKLEELSSTVYGISFLLFGCLFGFAFFILPFIALSEWMVDLITEKSGLALIAVLLIFLYLVFLIILLIDFVTNGLFRRIEWTAKIYYPIAVVFRILTLSFLYRRALLILVSNAKGWKSYVIPVVLLLVTFGFIMGKGEQRDAKRKRYLLASEEFKKVAENYEDQRQKGDYLMASIQSDVISESVLSLFLTDLSLFNTLHMWDSDSLEKWEVLGSKESSKALNRWLKIHIDSSNSYEPEWYLSQHPKELLFGFSTFLDLEELERGPHVITIAFDTVNMEPYRKRQLASSDFSGTLVSRIPFFYNPQ
ncbi:MAG: hypothetical protein AAF616_05730 [Bacteroidota bacterium]